ncbi:MAG: biopolymer transporter ExbD [Planctomycetota bacterium]
MTLSRFAPMIDLSFLLLIFFMTTTRFAQPEGLLSSRMQARASSGVALPFSPIVIRLTATGPADADVALAVDRFEGAPQALPKLPDFLRSIQTQPGFDRDTPVVLVGADEVRWDHVVGAWNAALRAGFKSIAFAEP